MNRLGKLIYTNAWDYTLYAVFMRDVSSRKISVDFYIVSPDDQMSDIITIPKKDIIKKKNCFDFLFDLEANFISDDIFVIQNKVMNVLNSFDSLENLKTRATMDELHTAVSSYIRENAENIKDNPSAEIFIKDGFGYMLTCKMDEFVKEYKSLGYKRLEILRRLKIMGVMKNGSNRAYDIQVSIGNEKKHFYKIELAQEATAEEKEDEVIK